MEKKNKARFVLSIYLTTDKGEREKYINAITKIFIHPKISNVKKQEPIQKTNSHLKHHTSQFLIRNVNDEVIPAEVVSWFITSRWRA